MVGRGEKLETAAGATRLANRVAVTIPNQVHTPDSWRRDVPRPTELELSVACVLRSLAGDLIAACSSSMYLSEL